MNARNLLVPCGGKSVGMLLQLKEAMSQVGPLRDGRVLVADRAPVTPGGSFADASFVVPEVGDAGYVDALLQICRDQEVRVLLPVIDLDLDRLAARLREFAALGTTVVCPPPDLVELCLDKQLFQAFCRDFDLPHPPGREPGSLREDDFPLFAKRRRGFGSIGAGVVRTLSEARFLLFRNPDLLLQELVVAPEISVDAFVSRDGRCLVRVPRARDKVVGGEAQQTHTLRHPAVADLADRTIAALAGRGLRGPLNIQLFAQPEPVLIEVNTRLGSASVLANAATRGRLFSAILADACGGVVDGDPDDYVEDLWLQRYWGDIVHDGRRLLGSHPPPVPETWPAEPVESAR